MQLTLRSRNNIAVDKDCSNFGFSKAMICLCQDKSMSDVKTQKYEAKHIQTKQKLNILE